MRELYYPSFEITNDKWLKYAILYKESVSTIVPINYRSKLSDKFREVHHSTDLLGYYNVSKDDTILLPETANVVMHYLSDIHENPNDYPIKHEKWENIILYTHNDLNELLQNGPKTYTIVGQKTTYQMENKLVRMGYAERTEQGIKVHYYLGIFYMSILASKITGQENSKFIATTDFSTFGISQAIFNEYLPIRNAVSNYFKKENLKQLIFNQSIPNLNQLSVEDVIDIRNKRGYRSSLKSFNEVIEKIINTENGRDLNLKEIDRQLTFYSEEMSGVRENLFSKIGTVGIKICVTTMIKEPILSTFTGEVLSEFLTPTNTSEITLRDVHRTKRLITNFKNI